MSWSERLAAWLVSRRELFRAIDLLTCRLQSSRLQVKELAAEREALARALIVTEARAEMVEQLLEEARAFNRDLRLIEGLPEVVDREPR